MPNSSTLTPLHLAVAKCPSSWAMTTIASTPRKDRIVIMTSMPGILIFSPFNPVIMTAVAARRKKVRTAISVAAETVSLWFKSLSLYKNTAIAAMKTGQKSY